VPVRNIIDGDVPHTGVAHRCLEDQLEVIEGADRDLRHEPGVAGIPGQTPDLLVVRAAKVAQEKLQVTNSGAEHVEPEVHAHRRVRVGRREARAYQFRRIAGSSREAGVDEGVAAGRGAVAGTIHRRTGRGIPAAATLKMVFSSSLSRRELSLIFEISSLAAHSL